MRPELTITNFTDKLEKRLDTRFHPMYRDSRIEEAKRALRDIVGESAWNNDLLDKRDIATLYALIEERKLNIPATQNREGHDNQLWLGRMVQETAIEDFGLRETDLGRNYANMKIVNQMLADSRAGAFARVDFDAITTPYGGTGADTALIDRTQVVPVSPIAAAQFARAPKHVSPKAKPEPKAAPTPKEPSSRAFENRWNALEEYCASIDDMEGNAITQFIAKGPKEALSLDKDTFDAKCTTARRSLSWLGVDSAKAQKLIEGLGETYHTHHEKRELGGVKRG